MKEMWNQRYTEQEYVYGKEPNILVKQFIDTHAAGKILFAADGEGRNSVYAAKKGWTVNAFDFSEEARKKAVRLAQEHAVQVNFTVADATQIELPDSHYDAVALIYFHLPPLLRQLVHQKMIRTIKPGGFLVLMGFEKKQIHNNTGGPKSPDLLFTKEMLTEDFKNLTFLTFEEKEIHLTEGPYHDGISHNILLIAKKS